MASSTSSKLKITVVQLPGAEGVTDLALLAEERLGGLTDTELIVFPELWTTPYCSRDRYQELAQTVPGSATEQMGEYARAQGASIVFGLAERDDKNGDLYNTAVWIDCNGELLAKYRKIHLATERERRYFVQGNQRVAVDIHGIRIGLLICYDLGYFPELSRAYALDGVKVLVAPSAWGDSYGEDHSSSHRQRILASSMKRLQVGACGRAFENRVYIVTSNRVGVEFDEQKSEYLEFVGGSAVYDPKGELIRALDREAGMFTVEIDVSDSLVFDAQGLNPLAERRPECY